MAERKCWYEEQVERSGVPFISIKNNGQSTLVFNPNFYEEGLGLEAFIRQGFRGVTKDLLQTICTRCDLCIPKIELEGGEGFRIYRRNYGYSKKDVPLAEFNYFQPATQPKGVRVAIIDDYSMYSTGLRFSREGGYEVMCVTVDANVKAGELATRQLIQKIISWSPDWAISDKGLGYVDGIEVINRLKEAGVRTIMLTGEIQTAETRRVADYFVTKPVTTEYLFGIIETAG